MTDRIVIPAKRTCLGPGDPRADEPVFRHRHVSLWSKRTGFTLIELLVVVAIIAILVSLMLPAIQSAREAARRAQCRNNLCQFGIALNNYAVSFGVLPPGSVNATGPIQTELNGYHMSWLAQILPLMEQRMMFEKIDFGGGAYSASNQTVAQTEMPGLQCPSDFGPMFHQDGFGKVISSNYVGCYSGNDQPIDMDNNGTMFLNSSIAWREIRDGCSNTLLAGEKLHPRKGKDLGWLSGTVATLRNTGIPMNTSPDVISEFQNPDDSNDAANAAADEEFTISSGGFSSLHAQGAVFLMADGSVRFISEHINQDTYSHLGNREDMQLLGNF